MAKAIQVLLGPPTKRGRLRPDYDEEVDILDLRSDPPRGWPFGVNIDSLVILDIDKDGILANVDLLISKQLWEVSDNIRPPVAGRKANLVFPRETLVRHRDLELPVKVLTDRVRSCAVISFGMESEKTETIELSDQCLAIVDNGRLTGFFVKLFQE